MKFTINASDLASSLRGPYDRAKVSSVIPILKHIRVKTSDQSIHLLGHDLDSSSEAIVAAEIDQEGSCCIPAEPLLRLISGLPKAAHVVFETQDQTVIIKSGRSRYKLPILDAIDMPEPLSAEGGFKFHVTEPDLEQLFVRCREAIDPKTPRTAISGIFLHGEEGKMAAVGTDTHALMRFVTQIPASDFRGAQVSLSTASELIKLGEADIFISDRIISITNGNQTYSSKLIDAVFPEHFRKVIPVIETTPIVVDRDYLLECVNRLTSIDDRGSSLVDIFANGNEISLSLTAESSGVETLECDGVDGDVEKEICLSGNQLIDALKSLKGEKVELYIISAQKPFRIIDPSEPSAINVLMPCASKNRRAAAA